MSKHVPSAKAKNVAPVARSTATLRDYLEVLRPSHWVKNVIVLAAPAASMSLTNAAAWRSALVAFAVFCLTASATYAINDAVDREADAAHAIKRHRPVARGAVRPTAAFGAAAVLLIVALVLSVAFLGAWVTIVAGMYFAVTFAYSVALKQAVILDVMLISVGFVLRAWAGALAVEVPPSQWLIACVFTLCMFMGVGKRRCELAMMAESGDARQHRETLVRYTPDLLNHLITVSAGIAVITFLLYTVDTTGLQAPFPKRHLFFSLPIVVYGIFRFAMLTELGRHTGPVEIILHDRPMQLSLLAWGAFAIVVAYQIPLFGAGGLTRLFGGG